MSQQPAAPLPPSVPEHSLAALISRGAMLKAQMNLAQEELGRINQQIADQTRFLEGKNTGHVFGGGYDVTVQKRTNIKWDQGKLRAARFFLRRELPIVDAKLDLLASGDRTTLDMRDDWF